MTSPMCALRPSTAISARRRTSRPRAPNWRERTNRRRQARDANNRRSPSGRARLATEIVAVPDPGVDELALGGRCAERGVDLFRHLVIGVGRVADESDVKLARGSVIADVFDRG